MSKLTEEPPAEEIDPKAQAAMDILIHHCLIYLSRQKSAADKGLNTEATDGRAS